MNYSSLPSKSNKQTIAINHLPKLAPLSLAVLTLFSTSVSAEESTEKTLPRIEVVGQGVESISRLPGSVNLVTNETILVNQPLSTQDAIKNVPGVVVREEEGYGFIPNIGMRGLDPNRSQKLLVLEDGVPIAPSLFISNESYEDEITFELVAAASEILQLKQEDVLFAFGEYWILNIELSLK